MYIKYFEVNILEVTRIDCSETTKITKTSCVSFAGNSRAQQNAGLISYLSNKHTGDRILKYQISPAELPAKQKLLSTRWLWTLQGTAQEVQNNKVLAEVAFCQTFQTP